MRDTKIKRRVMKRQRDEETEMKRQRDEETER